jgi:hypothetical protein
MRPASAARGASSVREHLAPAMSDGLSRNRTLGEHSFVSVARCRRAFGVFMFADSERDREFTEPVIVPGHRSNRSTATSPTELRPRSEVHAK